MHSDETTFDAALAEAARALALELPADQRAMMWRHFELVVEANRRFNLTRITTPVDAAVKHYADSLTLLKAGWLSREEPLQVVDVGTGAGFPAVPLAIACPAWKVLAIDTTGKKARFVADAVAAIQLPNAAAAHTRPEHLLREGRRFDAVLLRAVTSLADGLEQVHNLLSTGGSVIFYKTAQITAEEKEAADQKARQLKLTAQSPFEISVPFTEGPLARRLYRYTR